ncbi:MAG: NUDIX hydrolase [Pseudomonadota bacterium]
MSETVWKPHMTVAALCEQNGRYLMVKESIDERIVYNQPAGHLEPDETLEAAVIRETREETGYRFVPSALQGVYRYSLPGENRKTFIRFLFRGEVYEQYEGALDQGIIAAEWLTYEEILACREIHRTPMVLQCIEDSRVNPGFPLHVISRKFA